MQYVDVIRSKRDGHELTAAQIEYFVAGVADGRVAPEQIAALTMAVFANSMTAAETGALTAAMAASGSMLAWDAGALGGPVVDKHSTGGVGDKTSFLVAPIVAACGGYVPMVSGRGLGHTGGTLDKLDSIPGYQALPGVDKFRSAVAAAGCAIVGQTDDLAPADRRFYAVRDVTATVESIPLITASILSKKIAAGNRSLVMDIKWGSGAFMHSLSAARALAASVISTANATGMRCHALITDMNQPLGLSAGNAVEIAECVAFLGNENREPRLNTLVLDLAAEMLLIAGITDARSDALRRAEDALTSGAAAERFARMVVALGGPANFLERASHYLQAAPVTLPITAARSGYLAAVDARAVGEVVVDLGGGRRRRDDVLDLTVGFTELAPIGASIDAQRPLGLVHARDRAQAEAAARAVVDACSISADAPTVRPVVTETLTEPVPREK